MSNVERNPLAIKKINRQHVATLQRRANFLQALRAKDEANSYDLAELSALKAAIAELNEILEERK